VRNNVLHIAKVAGIGGAERHLLSLLPALQRTGLQIGMVVIASDQADRFISPLRRSGVDVDVLDAPSKDLSIRLARDLTASIRRLHPDIVHTHLIHADLYGQAAARRLGVRGVASIHSVHDFYRRHPYRFAAKIGGHLASRTIAISRYAAEFIVGAGIVRSDRARIVHYGIDPESWLLSADQRRRARNELGLDEGDVVVGMASRLIAGKGHEDAIRATGLAAESDLRIRLVIAGEGPMRESLEAAARAVPGDRIKFVGFVDDVTRLMNAVDIVCFPTQPSLGEGFGLAALEAMAAARPVVASAVASLPEIVDDGRTGVLVPPQQVGLLADAFLRLAADPAERERMGVAARVRAESTFSIDAMVRGTSDVYEEVLD
jgi:glycosyltransferase involved in cell wall biosynthesis